MASRHIVALSGRGSGKSMAQKVIADMLEKDIEAAGVEYLEKCGWFVFKIHQESRGKKRCHRGISDRIAAKNGRILFIEFKTRTGVQSEDQIKFEKDITSHGGTYILVRSLDELVAAVR